VLALRSPTDFDCGSVQRTFLPVAVQALYSPGRKKCWELETLGVGGRANRGGVVEFILSIAGQLSPFKFNKLVSLKLRGRESVLEELEAFLFAYANTLQYIHIIGCESIESQGGSYSTPLQRIARDWPKLSTSKMSKSFVFTSSPINPSQPAPTCTCITSA
jgi:hypothetical protein